MNRIWLTTDTHFNHWPQMGDYCGRPEDFEKRLFRGLREIPRTDTLIHLGDVCIGRDEAMHGKWIRPLQARKVLLMGNHDTKSRTWYAEHGWDFVAETVLIREFGLRILLSHFPKPYAGQFDVNVHGHFHNNLDRLRRKEWAGEFEERRNRHDLQALSDRHVLLSVEATNYRPVLLESMVAGFQGKGT